MMHRRGAQAAVASLGHLVRSTRGWLTAWELFCVCCVGAHCVGRRHGGMLAAVKCLVHQNSRTLLAQPI